jgi:hypothetical protein
MEEKDDQAMDGAIIARLETIIDLLAKDVLYDLMKWEFDQLAKRDPSFEDIVRATRQMLYRVEKYSHEITVRQFVELVDLMESVSHSVTNRDANLLIDCIAHLEAFIEIRKNGGHRRESTVITVHDNDKRPEASPEAVEESY